MCGALRSLRRCPRLRSYLCWPAPSPTLPRGSGSPGGRSRSTRGAPLAAPRRHGYEAALVSASFLRGAIAVVIALVPFGGIDVPLIGVSVVLVAMIVPATAAAITIVRGELRPRRSVLLAGMLLCVLSAILSTVLTFDRGASVTLVIVAVLAFGYATAIVLGESEVSEVGGWLPLLASIGGVIAMWALSSAGSIMTTEDGGVVAGRLQGPFAQPNELGVFCAAMLPIGVIAVVTATTRIGFAIQLLSTLAIGAAWIMSMSRGAWIGGCLALLIVAVFSPTTRKWLALALLGAIGFVTAALATPPSAGVIGVVGARLRSFSGASSNPYDDRPAIWAEAWRQAGEHPWVGVGPGGFSAASGGSASSVSLQPPLHPHNLVLTILAERGVVGLAAAGLVVIGCILVMVRAWQWYSRGLGLDSAWRIAAMSGLVAIAAQGLFDMPLRNPMVAALTWTLLGYAAVSEAGRPYAITACTRADVPIVPTPGIRRRQDS